MGQTIHITLLLLVVPAPSPPLMPPSLPQGLGEYQKLLLFTEIRKDICGSSVRIYIGHMPAQDIWICFARLGLPSPKQSSVHRLILSKDLEINLSLGFIKGFALVDLQRKPIKKISGQIRMYITYSF